MSRFTQRVRSHPRSADKLIPVSLLNLYWLRADGAGGVQRPTENKNNQLATSWHPSGKLLAYGETNAQTSDDLMLLPIDGDEKIGWTPGRPTAFLNTPAEERRADVLARRPLGGLSLE